MRSRRQSTPSATSKYIYSKTYTTNHIHQRAFYSSHLCQHWERWLREIPAAKRHHPRALRLPDYRHPQCSTMRVLCKPQAKTPKSDSSVEIREWTVPSLSLRHQLRATRGKKWRLGKGSSEEISRRSKKKIRRFGPSTQLIFGPRPSKMCVYKNSADHIFCSVRRLLVNIEWPKDCS